MAGYGNDRKKKATTFELFAQDANGANKGPQIYQSEALEGYDYDGCKDKEKCYSPGVDVDASCPSCTGTYLAFKFTNNQRNVQVRNHSAWQYDWAGGITQPRAIQILLPITITIDVPEWGTPFLIVFLALALAYVGGGFVFGKLKSRGGAGLRAHPHFELWLAGSGLVLDGVYVCFPLRP